MKKTALITGASHGIGRSIAEKLALSGYNVLINYHQSTQAATELYENLKNQNCNVDLFKADVSNKAEVDAMMAYCVKTFGFIDCLINNAAIAESKLFTDITETDWDHMMNVNLKGVFNCSQSALAYMLPEKKGAIVNISSVWGITGASMEVHYSTSKAAVIGLTKALAKELGPSGITVNCVAPGVIMTRMLDEYTEEDLYWLKDQTPLGRIGSPDDVAGLVKFLISDEASFITGQVLSPNGGFVI